MHFHHTVFIQDILFFYWVMLLSLYTFCVLLYDFDFLFFVISIVQVESLMATSNSFLTQTPSIFFLSIVFHEICPLKHYLIWFFLFLILIMIVNGWRISLQMDILWVRSLLKACLEIGLAKLGPLMGSSLLSCKTSPKSFFLFCFMKANNVEAILKQDTWLVHSSLLVFKPWAHDCFASKNKTLQVLVQVKFPNLPLSSWSFFASNNIFSRNYSMHRA